MAISSDLFLAILAMDSYNRSYNQGLRLDESIRQIGNATIGLAGDSAAEQAASFFAQAYTINDSAIAGLTSGQTVISYRGTDSGWDVLYGWPTGGGVYSNAQATLAAQFYQNVIGAHGYPAFRFAQCGLLAVILRPARGMANVQDFDCVAKNPVKYFVRVTNKQNDTDPWPLDDSWSDFGGLAKLLHNFTDARLKRGGDPVAENTAAVCGYFLQIGYGAL
jgi:hypothetical protein